MMTHRTETTGALGRLPLSERREALLDILTAEFRASLLMGEHDDLPLDGNFFDLGLTSLRATELKERLEALLGREISSNVLFNTPNLARLLEHMVTDVLSDLFDEPAR